MRRNPITSAIQDPVIAIADYSADKFPYSFPSGGQSCIRRGKRSQERNLKNMFDIQGALIFAD